MALVKREFELRKDLMSVPLSIAEPRLRTAGLAWLDMVLKLFSQEVLSEVRLDWYRPASGAAPRLVLTLDSSKNFRTRPLAVLPDAPPMRYQRRERFDEAVTKLMAETTPDDLWAALANQRLAQVGAWEITYAWAGKEGESGLKDAYPRFMTSNEFLFYLLPYLKVTSHPWL